MSFGAEVGPTVMDEGVDGVNVAWVGIAVADDHGAKRCNMHLFSMLTRLIRMRPVLNAFADSVVTGVISCIVLGLCARFATPAEGLDDSGQLLVMSLLQF